MTDVAEQLEKLAGILKRPRYFSFSILISLTALTVYSLLNNFSVLSRYILDGDFSLVFALIPAISIRYFETLPSAEILLVVTISALVGLNITLAIFRLLELSEFGRENATSLTGAGIATLAPACTACAGAVVGLTGISSAVALIPFSGYIIRILAIILLAGSTVYTLNQIGLKACKI
ncbi:hypothetical protein GKQ38_04220 [Candidatus Nanohaloarchaea archaeon]|nr:hypothetical protein GKQ38_04220 [Candidatus Nanohaloarchaea archaeon]